ncbi:hypothetical protein CLV62_10783 [Dysgonomonas alginatilytica]|uniref:Uncharacterized protein n=1 Tax=Dysgonomonas alginatilytica TaxID=1605892 RepID=A0A2V3PSJ4_9BACT|nr:hypothetical protein [Dysgonomonas alginatilytica]PXV65491.1 hypothetical protein CLV62_10783 [Dysgonomonas alginatilytica]
MKHLKTMLALWCVLFSSLLAYPASDSIKWDAFEVAQKALGDNLNYLGAIKKLKVIEGECSGSGAEKDMYLQAAMTYNAFVINNSNSDSLCQKKFSAFTIKEPFFNFISEGNDAIDEIAKRSKDHQVIMINEIHWFSRERYFTNYLLNSFYNNGFRYLAMEAIGEDGDSLTMRGYPIASTGIYTVDPRMANTIRDAIEMGFTLVNYDYYGKEREYKQAENIYNKTLKLDTEAKVLVHAGGDHTNKCSGSKKMGYFFQEISGVEPFVIKQIKQVQLSKSDYKGIAIEESANVCVYDIGVINGFDETDFLYKPHQSQKSIKIEKLIASFPKVDIIQESVFLSVYIEEEFLAEGLKAIPVVSYLVDNKFLNSSIKLPQGEYIVTIRNDEGEVIRQNKIDVTVDPI